MTQLAGAAAIAAWLGASVLVLAEGRRALAAALALFALALALTLLPVDQPAAALLLAGGLIAAGLRLRDGRPGWAALAEGSTPRLMLCVVVGVVGGFAAVSLLPGPGPAPARAAVLIGGAMIAARLLSTDHRDAALVAASALCLVVGAVDVLAGDGTAITVASAAAAAAALLGVMPASEQPGG